MTFEHIRQAVDPDDLDGRVTSVWVRLKQSQARVGIQSTSYSDNSPGEIGVVIDAKYPVQPPRSPHSPQLSELIAAMETIGRLGEQMRVRSTVPTVKADDDKYVLGHQAVASGVDYLAGLQPHVWILESDPLDRSSGGGTAVAGLFAYLEAAQDAAAQADGRSLSWTMSNDSTAYADTVSGARWVATRWRVGVLAAGTEANS